MIRIFTLLWYICQGGRTATPYDGLDARSILALPVGSVAEPAGCHLYLWTTDAHFEVATRCVRRWGFRLVSSIVWCKVTRAGAPHMGGGHYLRHAHELCLFGVSGRALGRVRNIPSVFFEAPRQAHSAKPETLQDIAERLSPGPRIELFSRRRREGWAGWGLEYPRDAA
jgi:N6-adenosine-specific RNA methylase IME4